MRKWHRWLSIVFGCFLLWISATGVLSQIGSLVNKASVEQQATVAEGFITISAPLSPRMRAPSGKWRS